MSKLDFDPFARIEELEDRIEALEAALRRYGDHDEGCAIEPWHGKGPVRCSCGFFLALAPEQDK